MSTVSELLQRAATQHQAGDLAGAEQLYRQVLQTDARQADAWHLLGVLMHQRGQHSAAIELIRQAVELNGGAAEYHYNLAGAHLAAGDRKSAVVAYRQAISLKDDYPEAHNNLAVVLIDLGQWEEAASQCRRAVLLSPRYADAWNNLGVALRKGGRLDASAGALQRAVSLRPDYFQAYDTLSAVLEDLGRNAEARDCYARMLELRPGHARSHNNLGNVLKQLGNLDDAVRHYQEAVRLKPDYFFAHLNLGSALREQGHHREGLAAYAAAGTIRSTPGLILRSQLCLPLIMESVEEAESEERQIKETIERLPALGMHMNDPLAEVGTTPFYLAYLACNVREPLMGLARFYAAAAPSLSYVAPHCTSAAPSGQCPLRVGFLSRYFYNHPVGIHYGPLLGELSRERLQVIALRLPGPQDFLAQEISRHADRVVTLPTDLESARQAVAAEQLDALVYTEIGMDPLTSYLAYSRLAPVQCLLPGHPVTSGIPAIDYFISSEDMEPTGAEEHYSEKLVRLPSLPTTFQLPPLPAERRREEFGLDPHAHLYVCSQTLTKIHPALDELVAEILAADPQGRLVLFEGNQRHWTVALRERLARRLGGAIDRVDFLPRQDLVGFRQVLTLADVVLDSVHFSGGTSSVEALAVGAPIVTWPGEFMRGRQTLGFYRKLGVLDCVAQDGADYVRIALRLAGDKCWREEIRGRILAARDKLVESGAFGREFEEFLIRAVTEAGKLVQ